MIMTQHIMSKKISKLSISYFLWVLVGVSLAEAHANPGTISWICKAQDQKQFKMTLWKQNYTPSDRPWLLGAHFGPLERNLDNEGPNFVTNIYMIKEPNLVGDNHDPDYIFDITYKYVQSGENLFFQSKWFNNSLLFQVSGKNAWITILRNKALQQFGPLVCDLQ